MALRSRVVLNTCQVVAVRGPKKKKGGAKTEAPESSDIVNIFKDRPDVEIHATDRYPPWLIRMLDETYSPDDIMMQMYRGERIPSGTEQWTMVKSLRRTYLNDQNRYAKEDKIYESDDDFGESTGAIEEEELSVVAGGAAAGGETPAAGGEKKEGEKKEGEGAAPAKDAGGDKK